ncbi:MAG: response regulator [Gammaproteobacteria bacterium]|jgi:DNA-binding response OmpR family regulator|nr:response regulator [Gammaproteobacteria bacterium]MBU0769865.1 response regulator [Gammaproteobacteria bacterium]MBU1845950.1 response regulator [Gammaproteobacteria bacterium]
MHARIVLIEDQAEIRQLIRMTLDFGDFELVEAADADAGWTLIQDMQPHLVLLDVMMPGSMDGLALCRRLRADATTRGVPVILLTARGQQRDMDAGMQAGADVYLTKPFSPMELLDRIGELLRASDGR